MHALKFVKADLNCYEKWVLKKKKMCHDAIKEARNNEGPRPDKYKWPRCVDAQCCRVMIIGDNLNVCSSSNTIFRTSDRTRIVLVFLEAMLHAKDGRCVS